ncbi:hypothetical protein NW761_014179 [Fusarium oxysporum]|nr:hypothetical protein NW758_003887 [Fusarium oxysporum]KAJ4073583.1 hypothetical protein NW761_014179 [Fusarium oxysporum]WKT52801.1 hypothetical protein QSH57_003363 [Fusarium oxysporum f. sp. vasinfectum]
MPVDILSWLRQVDDTAHPPHEIDQAKPPKATQSKNRKRQRSYSSTSSDHRPISEPPANTFKHPTTPPDSPTSPKAAAEMAPKRNEGLLKAQCPARVQTMHNSTMKANKKRRPGLYGVSISPAIHCQCPQPASSASIIPDYRIRFAPDKKIDFCVYLDPHHDPNNANIASTVDTVRSRLPGLSIKPTDDLSLLSNPIAVPIETKRPGEGLDTANFQVATFLITHLTLLQRLVDAGASVPVGDGEKAPSVDDLGFLPGLIVQGNTWNFIAASRQDSRIVIWSETSLGSTGDIFGIYQIVASLQLLRQCIDTTYWPWLRRVTQRAATAAQLRDGPAG